MLMNKLETKVLGLITARGGSKGVPGKNIKLLAGKPCIAWTVEEAKRSKNLDRVIVSTDNQEIAEIAEKLGAEVPFLRPVEIAGDSSASILTVLHALDFLKEKENYNPVFVCLLQPTSPLRIAADIDGTIETALSKKRDAAVSVVETHHHPFLLRKIEKDGSLVPFITSGNEYNRRQDMPKTFFVNGAVFVNSIKSLVERKSFYPPGCLGFEMPPERSIQIDTPWDFYCAQLMLEHPYIMQQQ